MRKVCTLGLSLAALIVMSVDAFACRQSFLITAFFNDVPASTDTPIIAGVTVTEVLASSRLYDLDWNGFVAVNEVIKGTIDDPSIRANLRLGLCASTDMKLGMSGIVMGTPVRNEQGKFELRLVARQLHPPPQPKNKIIQGAKP